jgi:hypothetical protein
LLVPQRRMQAVQGRRRVLSGSRTPSIPTADGRSCASASDATRRDDDCCSRSTRRPRCALCPCHGPIWSLRIRRWSSGRRGRPSASGT